MEERYAGDKKRKEGLSFLTAYSYFCGLFGCVAYTFSVLLKNRIISISTPIVILLIAFGSNDTSNLTNLSLSEKKWIENNKNNNQENEEFNKNEQEDNKKTELTEIILPSNKSISINKEYANVFNNNEKIIVTSNGNPHIDSEAYNSELTLTEFIDKELNKYPAEFYTGKKVSVSNTLFDFDNDGINEVMFSFCEEYILLHYYNGKIYGYTLYKGGDICV